MVEALRPYVLRIGANAEGVRLEKRFGVARPGAHASHFEGRGSLVLCDKIVFCLGSVRASNPAAGSAFCAYPSFVAPIAGR